MTEEKRLRKDVLRDVVRAAERRRDGVLPMDVPGVDTTFRDETTLLCALHLRWLARLAGRIERRLAKGPSDLDRAVARAWAATAREMPGVRAVLDHYIDEPSSSQMTVAMDRALMREHALLASRAGHPADSLYVGARIEESGRDLYAETRGHDMTAPLRRRIRAVLAA
jgi:hypothetical protein